MYTHICGLRSLTPLPCGPVHPVHRFSPFTGVVYTVIVELFPLCFPNTHSLHALLCVFSSLVLFNTHTHAFIHLPPSLSPQGFILNKVAVAAVGGAGEGDGLGGRGVPYHHYLSAQVGRRADGGKSVWLLLVVSTIPETEAAPR